MGPPGDFGLPVLILRFRRARSSEKGVYIGNTGRIKNHENFVILFWSQESEKPIFTIFLEFLRTKIRDTGISSETTITEISSETTVNWLAN